MGFGGRQLGPETLGGGLLRAIESGGSTPKAEGCNIILPGLKCGIRAMLHWLQGNPSAWSCDVVT